MKDTIVFFIVAVFLVACGGNEKKSGKRAVKVGIETVSDGASCIGNEYVGTVESSSETVLSFELGGNITRILVNEGDKVVKGQRLADVSPTSLKNSYEASVATLAQAKDAWHRMKKLHEEGVVSEIKWVEIDTKLKQAESAERISREQLSHTSIVAPFSGVITGRIGEVGMNVLPGQPVLKLADMSSVDVVFSVPEGDITKVRIGERADVKVDAIGGTVYEGIVKEKGTVADKVSHSYNVRLQLSKVDGRLLSGMVCSVRRKSQELSNQVVIPMGAVELDTDNTRFVWTVVAGKAHRKNIVVGEFLNGGVHVLNGLNVGDKLIVHGTQKVCEGMSVVED